MKIAVIGTGLIGRKHIELIDRNPDWKLTATVSPQRAPQDIAERFGVPNFSSHQDLIDAKCVDAAIVASPNETHAEIAVDLIESGLPILVEKPIAGTVEDGFAIEVAARRNNIPVLVGHHRQYNPIVAEMRDIVEQETLGQTVGYSGLWATRKPDDYYDTEWRVGPSGGPVMINLIHEIDYLQTIIGPIEHVCAVSQPKRRAHGLEETVALTLTHSNGTVGTVLLSDSAASPWTWEQATGENVPTFPQSGESPYRFVFESGAVEFPRIRIWSQETADWTHGFSMQDRDMLVRSWTQVFEDQIAHFYEVAAGKAPPKVTAREGIEALNVALTVKQAIQDGCAALPVPTIP